MSLSVETYALSKKYTNDSIAGISGTLAGKNCTIQSITDIEGGHRVTFQWTADDSTTRTSTMDVMDGSGAEAIEQIYADNGVTGAKNLLDWKTSSGSDHSVDFTVNSDKTITADGTATGGNAIFYSDMPLKAGTYILNGAATGGQMQAYLAQSPWTNYGYDTGNGVTFTLPSDSTIRFQCIVLSGTTVNNVVFKPMLRLASDPDDTYQPYAMTNRELTEAVFEKGTLDSTADLNDVIAQGVYHLTTKPINAPSGGVYSPLLVYRRTDSDVRQVIYGNNNKIYTRQKGGSPAAWGHWFEFSGTDTGA